MVEQSLLLHNGCVNKVVPLPDLEPPEDGLRVRDVGPWAREKLGILRNYYPALIEICSSKRRPAYCVDGLAGPGYNRVIVKRRHGQTPIEHGRVLGSPMVAVKMDPPFTSCLFMATVDAELKEWTRMKVAGEVTDVEWRAARAPLAAQKAAIEADIAAAAKPRSRRTHLARVGDPDFLAELDAELVETCVERVTVLPVGKGGRWKSVGERVVFVWRDGVRKSVPASA
jgi:hypothetical protein